MTAKLWHLSASEMARRMASGQLSSLEVVSACLERIKEVNEKINAVVALRGDQALAEAAAADERRRQGQPGGPLAGVPITIKECFYVAGLPATLGMSRHAGDIAKTDGPPVARLRQAGAIVLGTTNVPQAMLNHECDNPLYGRTNNPWNLERTSGGSSGGEGAIIAAGGSPLGLGSDLGGSIRVPCHFCGITGIMPTERRLDRAGTALSLRGLEAIQFQPGPMARSVEDLQLALRVLGGNEATTGSDHPPLVPLGEPSEIDLAGLRIGFWSDDGYFTSSPAVARAVEEAAATLEAAGASVERFTPPDMREALAVYFGLLSADGGADLKRQLAGSEIDARLKRLLRLGGFPRWSRPPLGALLRLSGQDSLAELFGWCGPRSTDSFWQLTVRRDAYRQRFQQAMQERGLDLLLAPPHALPAMKHGRGVDLLQAASSTVLVNLLGYPAGATPITRVRADEEDADRSPGRDSVLRIAASTERGSAGLPVGVQVIGRPWQETQVLAAMAELEGHFMAGSAAPAWPEL